MKTRSHLSKRKRITVGSVVAAVIFLLGQTHNVSAQWTGSLNIYYNGGNVGIGTTAPTDLLTVYSADSATSSIGSASLIRIRNTSSADNRAVLRLQKRNAANTDETYGDFRLNNAGDIEFAVGDSGILTPARMVLRANGNVGIGTTNPATKFHVSTPSTDDGATIQNTSAGNGFSAPLFLAGTNAAATVSNVSVEATTVSGANSDMYFRTGGSGATGFGPARMVIDHAGNVGIGTITPGEKLEVSGNLKVFGTSAGNITATGTIEGGNIRAKYQDVAEWVPTSEQIPRGTVVVLDSTKSNQVISSTQAYDTRVAGVVSEKPGIALGEGGANKVLVATTGRVLVNVDASKGPIHIGDLLVTSDVPGLAMKSEPITIGNRKMHMPGTLIGKALEPLEKGSGKILVLLSLQ
jgi:hypothetical protein